MLDFKPSPTAVEFMLSEKYLKLICGPVGGGKSTAALFECFRRAKAQSPFNGVRRTKVGILRNTMAQLKATVKPLIDQWFVTLAGGQMGQWRLTENVFEMKGILPDGTTLHTEFMMLAADSPDDVRRLLSLELSFAWVEEAREVDPEVFSGLQGRVNRYPSRKMGGVTCPGVICSTNPPPLGGFWHEFMTNPTEKTAIFMQPCALLDDGQLNPDAENLEYLAPDYYDNLVSGKTEAWIDVYLKNKFGPGEYGNPVYKSSFKSSFHVSKTPLKAIMQTLNPLIIGMDNGLQAAASIGQQDMRGRVNILGECYVPSDQTMGVETYLDRLLIPKLRGDFAQIRPENIVFVVDPACFVRSQVDEKTIAQAISARGFKVIRATTNDPERRIGAVEGLLTRQIDGGPAFLIDPSCTHTINGFEWGYRFKKSTAATGPTVAEKNHFSHLADGVQYLALHYNLALNGGGYNQRKAAQPISRTKYVYA